MADEIRYELKDAGIAVVTLNRPAKLNAINAALTLAFAAIVKRIEADPAVRVVILTSSSERAFCVGADLAALAAGEGPQLLTADGGLAGFTHAARRKPWIAAVRGRAMGGGLELALGCDMIVAADDAQFGLPEPAHGVIAAAGGVTRLSNAIPRHIANELIATGALIGAERAYALGLVNRVVPAATLFDAALELAQAIARNAPLAVQEALALSREAAQLDETAAFAASLRAVDRLRDTEDFAEGPRAFVEKRAPVWRGR